MEQAEAAALTAQEGIVCHLTSLVLVDDAADARNGLPATRKVAMSRPRSAMLYGAELAERSARLESGLAESSARLYAPSALFGDFASPAERAKSRFNDILAPIRDAARRASVAVSLERAIKLISWNAAPDALRQGNLSSLSESLAETIRQVAALPDINAAAKEADLDPVVFVVGLLARAAGKESRTAARIARATFGSRPAANVALAAPTIGL